MTLQVFIDLELGTLNPAFLFSRLPTPYTKLNLQTKQHDFIGKESCPTRIFYLFDKIVPFCDNLSRQQQSGLKNPGRRSHHAQGDRTCLTLLSSERDLPG